MWPLIHDVGRERQPVIRPRRSRRWDFQALDRRALDRPVPRVVSPLLRALYTPHFIAALALIVMLAVASVLAA